MPLRMFVSEVDIFNTASFCPPSKRCGYAALSHLKQAHIPALGVASAFDLEMSLKNDFKLIITSP